MRENILNLCVKFVMFQDYLDDLLKRIQDLLVLQTPGSVGNSRLSSQDQMFIYETTGILIVQSNFAPEVSTWFP